MEDNPFTPTDYTRETAEEYFSHYVPTKKMETPVKFQDYEPVLYEVVKDPHKMKNSESLIDIQKGFVRRAENLLKVHKHRAALTDGLKGMSDPEIIQKIRDVPTRIKSKHIC